MPRQIRGSWMGRILEICWVFLPYAVFRDYFPKTSLGLAATNMKTTVGNKRFYYYGTLAIKLFYIWGKHFMYVTGWTLLWWAGIGP
eukprot:scaffold115_cov304-Prasinococcus_capsulatus_cf.AAC.62